MKIIKKVGVLLITAVMVTGTIFIGNTTNTYAQQTTYKKQLLEGQTYKCDLDGDKDKDSIKVYVSNNKLLLKVNSKVVTLIPYYDDEYPPYYTVRIYDFNKKDKSLDILFQWEGDSEWGAKLLKFKNSTCKVNKNFDYCSLFSESDCDKVGYNSNTGIVTFCCDSDDRYAPFVNSMGMFFCYEKIKVNGYNVTYENTAEMDSCVKQNKYVAAKNLTAYTSTSGKTRKYTVKKGSKVKIYSLYRKGNSKLIKIKNSSNQFAYIKAGSSLLFEQDSCLWWR